MKKFLIGSVVAASLLATIGSAANIATDGTGEYLIGGKYYAQPGFSSNVKLINTNLVNSVVVRVVVRSFDNSSEVDFIVTLSPGDVWEGDLAYTNKNTSNKLGPTITSTDDSNLDVNDADNPISKGINMNVKNTRGSFASGYIEVFPMFSYNHEVDANDGIGIKTINGGSTKYADKVRKEGLKDNFSLYDLVWAVTTDETAGQFISTKPYGGYNYYGNALSTVGKDDIYGEVSITSTSFTPDFTASLPMLAVEDINASDLKNALEAGNGTVLANMAPAHNTVVSEYFGTQDLTDIYNALAVNAVTVPYTDKGKDQELKFSWWYDGRGAKITKSNYETETNKQIRYFHVAVRDMEENRPTTTITSNFISPPPAEPVYNKIAVSFESGTTKLTELFTGITGWDYEKGMIKLVEFEDRSASTTYTGRQSEISTRINVENPNLAGVVTYQQAIKNPDGGYSVTWKYPAVER